MACWSEADDDENDVDGVCPECGDPTIGGIALNPCAYSPIICEECQHSPCDGSC